MRVLYHSQARATEVLKTRRAIDAGCCDRAVAMRPGFAGIGHFPLCLMPTSALAPAVSLLAIVQKITSDARV